MCLTTLKTTEPEPELAGQGYKVFRVLDGKLFPSDVGVNECVYPPYPVGVELIARNTPLTYQYNPAKQEYESYTSGFHVFRKERHAKQWQMGTREHVYRVSWRHRIVSGEHPIPGHPNVPVDVVQYMTIHERVPDGPA